MNIVIDTSSIYEFLALPADVMLLKLLFTVGWIPIAIVMLWGFFETWVYYIQLKWGATQKFILLAIDIPRGNDQSPKAVENLFSYLAGAHSTQTLIEKYWEGQFQLSFAFEVVSIEGYTQFLIHTPEHFRNLVESAVYSQYPDAEITEVNDYTAGIPNIYPNDEYDIWGAEFIQRRSPAYPIKTYVDFEHQFGDPEFHFRDPMATLMDLCSSLRAGEQLWYQIIVTPIGFDWPEIGAKEISKVLGEKTKGKENIFEKLLNGALGLVGDVTGVYLVGGPAEEKKEEPQFKMMNLKPEQKRQVEMIQEKVGKLGFEFKIRMIYVAKNEVMNKPKVANGFVGYMKQYAWNDLNNLKPDMDITATKATYFFKDYRLKEKKRKIMKFYKNRSRYGRNPGILNIEELASLWHFPIESVVRAPLIQKAPGRKAEPPMTLPIGEEVRNIEISKSIFEEAKESRRPAGPAAGPGLPAVPPVPPSAQELFTKTPPPAEQPPDNLPIV